MEALTQDRVIDNDMNVILDNELISYDCSKYPFVEWIQNKIEERGFDASDLSRLHETIPYDQISPMAKWIIRETGNDDWRQIAHSFTREMLEPIFGADIAVQRYMNLRILLPTRHEMIINFHTGLWYGHGMGTGTCWLALTPCFGTNSMLVIDRHKSIELCDEALRNNWRQDKMQEVFYSYARPVVAGPGKAFLFNQEIVHGNVPNETNQTRVSIDFRLTVRGGKIRRKLVGGYYVLLNEELIGRRDKVESGASSISAPPGVETKPQEDLAKDEGYTCISYVNNNTRITSGIPIVLQRLMMRDYCEPLGLKYTYEQLELEVMPYLPTLQHVIEQDRPNEIVMYSVNALPENHERRDKILDLALEHKVKLHFANEDCRFESEDDRKWIDDVLSFGEIEVLRHEA